MHQNFQSSSLTARQRCVGFGVVVMEDEAFPIDQFLIAWRNLSSC